MEKKSEASEISQTSSIKDKNLITSKKTNIPELNPQVLNNIEKEAKLLAKDYYKLNKKLQESLNNISAASVCSSQAYEETIEKNCDVIDDLLREDRIFLIKAKEISRTMEPIYKLHEKINSIKTVISTLESQV